jgi:AbiU2
VTLPPRPVTRRDVKKFIDHCLILRAFWTHYQTIFEGSDLQRELLQNTARIFFGDLNQMLIEHLILQICKLTDPEVTMGKRNLTIPFLVNNADLAATPRDMAKLKKIAERIEKFRKQIKPARNMRISHLDLDSAHRRKSLGGASVTAWRKFWIDLQDAVAILHKRYVNARVPFYLNGVGMMSDAHQLVRAIKESTYFHVLLDDTNLKRRVSDVAYSSKYHGP